MRQTYTEGEILHHSTDPETTHSLIRLISTTGKQVLHATVGIDFHGTQILKSVDKSSFLAEFLPEGIAQIMRGVGRDKENGLADFRKLNGERAGRRRLSNTAFSSDENPAERLLVEQALERRLHDVVCDHSGRHVCKMSSREYDFLLWYAHLRVSRWGSDGLRREKRRKLSFANRISVCATAGEVAQMPWK